MKNTMKLMEGLAIGMILGGAAGAFLASRMKSSSEPRRKFAHAVKSACGLIEEICG